MKKLMIIALTVCMFVLTGCSSEKKPEQDPQVDDGPAVVDEKPAEFIVINNDSYDELVAILNGKNLYKPDEFYKGEFSNQNGLSGYQYEWAKSSVNGKEFTLGNTVYHLTGEVKGGSSRIRFEAEEATFYLAKDNEGYWGLYITDKGTSGPVGIPYVIAEQFTYWHENEAWNKGYIQLKEKLSVNKHDFDGYTSVIVDRVFYCGINKEFYDKVIVSNCAKSTLIIRIDKSYDNYEYTVTLNDDYTSATLVMGDVSKFGPTPKAALYGGSVFPQYIPAANSKQEQYEEDGMIWFRIFDMEIGRYVLSGDRELELTQTIHDAKYTVNVYTNHLFLPKDYK